MKHILYRCSLCMYSYILQYYVYIFNYFISLCLLNYLCAYTYSEFHNPALIVCVWSSIFMNERRINVGVDYVTD